MWHSRKTRKFDWLSRSQYLAIAILSCLLAVATPSVAQDNFVAPQTQAQVAQNDLLTQGRIAYQLGKYAEATQTWQQAERSQTSHSDRALVFNYLALSSQKQGNWQQAKQYIDQSLALLTETSDYHDREQNIYAQALNTRGRLELAMGQPETALATWKQAETIYQQAQDELGTIGSRINQAQALQTMGLYRRSQKLLEQINQELNQQSDPTLKVAGLRSLGHALRVTGDLDLAQKVLQQSLTISQQLNLPEESSATLFSLANTARVLPDPKKAIALYRQAATSTTQLLPKTEIQLNQLDLLVETNQWQLVNNSIVEIHQNIDQLSSQPSRRSLYAEVNFAQSLLDLPLGQLNQASPKIELETLLLNTITKAQQLADTKAESYALGVLGKLYQKQQQNSKALTSTKKALLLAQNIADNRLKYQWQWQLGKLQINQGKRQDAIASYSEAINSLEALRNDLIVTNLDYQFSFRNSIEPVYRELVSLLLESPASEEVTQKDLLQARQTIEALQLAELNDYFREACLDAQPTDVDKIDRQAAVIYPIILGDRLEVIVAFPGKSLRHYTTQISAAQVSETIEKLRQTVAIRSRRQFYQPAQEIYQWLIRPALADLEQYKIETLVFVPDGVFRNIPMAVLHDGEHYLIEKYNVALTPGLELLAPRPLEQLEMKTLAMGLTEARDGFAALDYVQVELEDIQDRLDSTVLLNGEFTQESFTSKVKSAEYPIVHVATHGQFSSLLEETFLLAWDGRIAIDQLNQIFQQQNFQQQEAIELLVLSACETAVGDDRAALGLAGMAIKAGAKSTVATLWSVNDKATATAIANFYQKLTRSNQPVSKAQALRQTQLDLISSQQYSHPFYWAPFILVGNWL